ncbi:MAG: SPOR domain-containing protein, partial [Pseudomonadota bacterium]|nr:SPOR domain-containing protein [Pseudomonadota bacterium]
SPILPLPCYARVTNLDNGRSVIVRVNDRGPFLSDRIMDLSYAAAYKLGYAQKGIARVSVDLIDHPGSYEARTDPPRQEISDIGELVAGNWYLQLGAYTNRDDAEHLLVKARQVGSVVLTQQDGIFRVEGGPYPSRVAAQQEAGSFGHALGLDPMVILARP